MRVGRQVYIFIAIVGFIFFVSLVILARLYFKKDGIFFIETDRLILRKFRRRDKRALSKVFLKNEDVVYFSTWKPIDREGAKKFIRKTFKSYKENGYGQLAVILKEKGKLIGSCGLHKIKIDGQDLVEMVCQLAKKYCGKGLGTEASKAVRDYAFRYLYVDTVLSCIHPYNVSSIRVAEKNGMRYLKEGKFLNHHCLVYGITRDEWNHLK